MPCRPTAPLIIAVLLVSMAVGPAALAADEGTYSVREYPLPADASEIGAMTIDASGNVWLIQNSPPVLYKLVRENLTFSRYDLEGFARAGFAGMSVDDQGNVWFADPIGNRFGAYTEADNHTAHFDFPGPMAPTSVIRRGDTVWLGCKEEIGEYDLRFPEEPLVDHFVYKYNSRLYDIHFDRKGDIWCVEYEANNVSVYWHNYNRFSEFAVPTADAGVTCLAIDNRSRLWFVENGPNKLGMFHTETFSFAEYDLPAIEGLVPVVARVATVNDSVWLTDKKYGRAVRFLPDRGQWAAASLGNGTAPAFVEPDGNGTLWIYEAGSHKLASLGVTDQFGQATPTPAPTATPTPSPSPAPTPQPTKAPGFALFLGIIALASATYVYGVKK